MAIVLVQAAKEVQHLAGFGDGCHTLKFPISGCE
jgi:hypothetical protein